jgi:signal transduction histidine kinase
MDNTPSSDSSSRFIRIDVMPEIPDHPSALSADLSGFVRQLPQCVFICDAHGRCLLANGPLLRWLGRAEAAVVGETIFDLWPDDPRAGALPSACATREAADLQLVLEGGRIEQVETRTGTQGPQAVRAVKFPWRTASGKVEGMVVVFDELPANRRGEAGSLTNPETVGHLAHGIVHDLNNALMMVYGQFSLLAEALPASLGLQNHLRGMHNALEHACQLPRQLMKFSRGEPLERQRLDLNVLLSSLEGLLRPRLGPKTAVELRFAVGGAWVEGDPVELARALLNLARNALDAMPHGGRLVLETRPVTLAGAESEPVSEAATDAVARARSRRSGTFIRVTISDSGTGISPDVMPHIFERHFSTRPAGKGSGLGLAIVKEVVTRHGGWITCQSNSGEGTCFVLHLPALVPDADSPGGALRSPGGRVLVVEPDAMVRQLALVHLRQGPFRAQGVESLEEARRHVTGAEDEFELVVVSSDLCGGYGGAELSALLAEMPEAELLVTNSGLMPPLPPDCKVVLRRVLAKPYKGEQLLRVVQAILGGKAVRG